MMPHDSDMMSFGLVACCLLSLAAAIALPSTESNEATVRALMEDALALIADDDPHGAYTLLLQAHELGDTTAAGHIAHLHLVGLLSSSGRWDPGPAMTWLSHGAARGDPASHSTLGIMYATGLGDVPRDMANSLLHYYFANIGGSSPESSMVLGYRHLHGIAVPKSCDAAVRYYMPIAEQVVKELATEAGIASFERYRLVEESSRHKSTDESTDVITYFEHAANGGDVNAQLALGQLAEHGLRGVPQDYRRAAMFFERAVEQGDPQAMAHLGSLYANGHGVVQNNETALDLFQRSARLGHAGGYAGLGLLYMRGQGTARNIPAAIKYLKEAADRGNTESQHALGIMYQSGEHVDKSHVTALHYFTAAGHQGHTPSLFSLGQMHLLGLGTVKSCSLSVRLLKVVAERGPWAAKRHNEGHAAFKLGKMEEALLHYVSCGMYGDEACQLNAGWMLSEPLGYYNDDHDVMAVQFWRMAADQGNAVAQRVLGDYCYSGLVSGGRAEASRRYQQAADRSDAQAMFNMGYLHQVGPEKDLHLAKRFYDQAKQVSAQAYAPVQLALLALHIQIWWSRWHSTKSSSKIETPSWTLSQAWDSWEDVILALLCVALASVVFYRRNRVTQT